MKLINPSIEYIEQFRQMRKEGLIEENFAPFYGVSDLNMIEQIKVVYGMETYWILDEEDLVGVVTLRFQRMGEYVDQNGDINIIIRPSKRNQGFGTKAYRQALEIFKSRGKSMISITTQSPSMEKILKNTNGENLFFIGNSYNIDLGVSKNV